MYAYKMRDKEPDGVTVAQVGLTCSRNNSKMFFLDDVNVKKKHPRTPLLPRDSS